MVGDFGGGVQEGRDQFVRRASLRRAVFRGVSLHRHQHEFARARSDDEIAGGVSAQRGHRRPSQHVMLDRVLAVYVDFDEGPGRRPDPQHAGLCPEGEVVP